MAGEKVTYNDVDGQSVSYDGSATSWSIYAPTPTSAPYTPPPPPANGLDLSGTGGIKAPVEDLPPDEAIAIYPDGSANPNYDQEVYEAYIAPATPGAGLSIGGGVGILSSLFGGNATIDDFFTRIQTGGTPLPIPTDTVEPVTGRTDTFYQPKYPVGSSLQPGQNMWGDASNLAGLLSNPGQAANAAIDSIFQNASGDGEGGTDSTGGGYSGLGPSSIDVPDSYIAVLAAINPTMAITTKTFVELYNLFNLEETVTPQELSQMQAELDSMHAMGIDTSTIQTKVDDMLSFNVTDLGYDINDLPEALVNPNIVDFDKEAAIASVTSGSDTTGGIGSSGNASGDGDGFGSGSSTDSGSGAVATPADMDDGLGDVTSIGDDGGFGSGGGGTGSGNSPTGGDVAGTPF